MLLMQHFTESNQRSESFEMNSLYKSSVVQPYLYAVDQEQNKSKNSKVLYFIVINEENPIRTE